MPRAIRSPLGWCLCLVGLVAAGGPAAAQTDYFWNAPNGGTGTWNTSDPGWSTTATGLPDYTWANSGSERANFGNTFGTVTLGTAVSAYGLNFSASGYEVTGNTLTLTGPGGVVAVDTGPGGGATVNSTLAGSVGLTKTGAGTLVLGAASSYTGGTAIDNGTVHVNNLGALGSGAVTLNPNGTATGLVLGVTGTFANAVTVTANAAPGTATIGASGVSGGGSNETAFGGTITLNQAATLQGGNTFRTRFTGRIAGTGAVTVTNAGGAFAANKVVFDNQTATANSFGQLTIAAFATLQLGNGGLSGDRQIPNASDVTFESSTSALWFAMGSTATGESVNAINGAAGVIKTSASGTSAGTYTFTVGAGNGSGSFGGTISEDTNRPKLQIIKAGTGTQVLAGDNTYTGGTAVNGGRLLVNGQTGVNSGTGTGAVTVNTGGTLGGTGRAAGAVAVNAGGRVLAGDGTAASQTLTLGGNLTVDGTAANPGRIQTVAGGGGSHDNLTAAGTVAVGGSFGRAATTSVIRIEIALDGSGFDLGGGTTYSRRVLAYGSLGANWPLQDGQPQQLYSTEDNVFQVTGVGGVTIANGWQVLVGLNPNLDPENAVYVLFTPVPEPAAVLAVAAAGLGLTGLARRRLRRRA